MNEVREDAHTSIGNASSQEEELLDVVDHKDNVLGTATRGMIHQAGLFHRAVHIFLFNSSGEIYVQRRSEWKDRYPLKLDSSAAGHVDKGESYLESAKRELMEELGIETELTEILKIQGCPETDNEHVVLYEAHSNIPPLANKDEIAEGWFMRPSKLSQMVETCRDDFVPAFTLLWKLFTEKPVS
ncbi:MAG: NUDIX domain-containing protein [Pseudomonadota bacterium]